MTLPRRHRAASALSRPAPPIPVPAPTADDWRRAIDLLETTVRRRDGDDAARHTEIRRRMRALARAARTLTGPKAG